MANTVVVTEVETNIIEVAVAGPQGPAGASGGGDMTKAVYDPANIAEQLLGISDIDVTVQGYDANTSITDVAESRTATINMQDNEFSRPELKDYAETIDTNATSGATTTIDLENGNVHEVTLTDNCTFTFSNAPTSGKGGSFTLILHQDGSGGHSVTWPDSVKWAGSTAPTLTTDIDAIDILGFITTDGGTNWYGFAGGLDMG